MTRRVITKDDAAKVQAYLTSLRDSKSPDETPPSVDDYKGKIIKYIPGEVVAAFLTASAIIEAIPGYSQPFYWVVFIVLLLTTFVLAYYVSEGPKPLPPSWGQALLSSIAFIVWVLAIGGPFKTFPEYETYMGGIILIIFTPIAPILPELYKKWFPEKGAK